MKRVIAFVAAALLVSSAYATTEESSRVRHDNVIEKNQDCVTCHAKEHGGIVGQWEDSEHHDAGVGCYSCHAADKDDSLGYEHEGAFIKTVTTPKDCSECHEDESHEFQKSHHAKAGQIMASLDNMLAEVVASFPDSKADAVNGCWQCHGSVIRPKRDKDTGELIYNAEGAPVMDPMTWPNSGIGRINHDGSKGTCNACHSRHDFDATKARQPENCGKCHMGPDHPQKEIYNESKHGIAYRAAPKGDVEGGMDIFKRGDWILGEDYTAAPTCSTCHMGAYKKGNGSVVQGSHNVGDRISWTLRPKVSKKLNRVIFEDGTETDIPGEEPPNVGEEATYTKFVREGDKLVKKKAQKVVKEVISWEDRRDNMKGVCENCHSSHHVDNFYEQYDSLVNTYNDKFAKPAVNIVDEMKKDGLWENSMFQDSLGYIFFELWHHEGRRARMGAAMMGPDYTHWHGMYEVSNHFYNKFLPKVLKIAKEGGMKKKYQKMIDEIIDRPEHEWYKTGGNPKTLEMIREAEKARYDQ